MPVHTSIWFWIAFHLGVFIALALDLASFKRRARALSMRAATQRSALWMVLSFGFCALIWQWQAPQRGLDFLTGYLIERSEEHTSELQSRGHLVCRLLLEKK